MTQSLKTKDLRTRLLTVTHSLSSKESEVARYITDNPEKIMHGTISQIGHDLGLADSTIFRFCKKLGYSGFQELKIAMAQEMSHTFNDVHEKVVKSDSELTILEKVFQSNIRTLNDTLEVINEQNFKEAVDKIVHSNRLEFFGVGGSMIIALDGYHKFIRTGLNVNAQMDSHLQLMSASQLKEGDVAVLISHTGQSNDLLDILNVVKSKKVFTISLTGFAQSALSSQSDIALHTLSEETDFRSEALASRIAQLSLLDALYVNAMLLMGERGKVSLESVRQVIQKKKD